MAATIEFNIDKLKKAVRDALIAHSEKCQRAMTGVANMLLKEARFRAPFDAGNLTGSISSDVVEYRKNWAARVFVPSDSEASAYAVWMHEGNYNLGEKSLDKQNKVGKKVGPGYLTRAIEENMEEIRNILKESVK